MHYIIEGGKRLSGEVKISGNKNAILPCMAAALLTQETVILTNVPRIVDVEVLIKIFESLGVKLKTEGDRLTIKASTIKRQSLPDDLVIKLRASILLVGPLLARLGRVSFHYPGGDIIGQRSIAVHLNGLQALGAKVEHNDLKSTLSFKKNKKASSCHIFLEEASVTATENLILASVIGQSDVALKNCSSEPHVADLCQMLLSMGGNISGIGTDTLTIRGVDTLLGTSFKVGDDYLEISTYTIAAALTSGKIKIICNPDIDLDPILSVLNKFGVSLIRQKDGFLVRVDKIQAVPKVVTNIWPGFPTDLMSAVIVLATQAQGVTLCHDWMYESRMFFTDKLISMGANIVIADPHRVLVYGPTTLHGKILESPDIRAGMALVLAALAASGKSRIFRAELIERGYEDVVGKLKNLGASIKKIV